MSQTSAVYRRLRQCIEVDIAARVKAHQAAIARLQIDRRTLAAAGVPAQVKPLGQFKNMLTILASKPANHFVLVDTQGMLAPADWANELHAYAYGFQALAVRFVNTLRTRFPGRI